MCGCSGRSFFLRHLQRSFPPLCLSTTAFPLLSLPAVESSLRALCRCAFAVASMGQQHTDALPTRCASHAGPTAVNNANEGIRSSTVCLYVCLSMACPLLAGCSTSAQKVRREQSGVEIDAARSCTPRTHVIHVPHTFFFLLCVCQEDGQSAPSPANNAAAETQEQKMAKRRLSVRRPCRRAAEAGVCKGCAECTC